jgi:phosphoribosylaminoimidazolecarboxamide formyltransferase/IMP cyclohydrolase
MKKALISVSDKTGIIELAQHLITQGFELIASGGTCNFLKQNNIPCILISDYTGVPETTDGRVKTLHPKIYQNILNSSVNTDETIDVVVVNLYDFKTKQSIENIDIGGVTLIRAAAKNHELKTVLINHVQYQRYISGRYNKRDLAIAAFELTVKYDTMISDWLSSQLD